MTKQELDFLNTLSKEELIQKLKSQRESAEEFDLFCDDLAELKHLQQETAQLKASIKTLFEQSNKTRAKKSNF
jgi:hypothetical protein